MSDSEISETSKHVAREFDVEPSDAQRWMNDVDHIAQLARPICTSMRYVGDILILYGETALWRGLIGDTVYVQFDLRGLQFLRNGVRVDAWIGWHEFAASDFVDVI